MNGEDYTGTERRQAPLEVKVRDLEEGHRATVKSLASLHKHQKEGFDGVNKKLDCFTESCANHRIETAKIKTAHNGLESFVKWSTSIYCAVSAMVGGLWWHSKR